MSQAAFLELVEPAGGLHAWIGSGLPGLAGGEGLLVAFEGQELLAAGTIAAGGFELSGGGARVDAELEEMALQAQVSGSGAELQTGVSEVKLRRGGAERTLDVEAAFGRVPSANGSEPQLLRALNALPGGEGTAFAAGSTRPPGAPAHDAERLSAWLLPASGDPRQVSEPLLSTQYDAAGAPARAGLELWVGADDHLPLRIAGVRTADIELALSGGWRLRAATFRWMLGGDQAPGSYLIWRRDG